MTTNAKWVKMCVLAALFGSVGTGNIWGDTFPSIQSVQQSNKVTGLVSDDMGPVAGASISVKGTSNGTISIIRKTKNSSFKNEKSKKEVDVTITTSDKDIV